MKHYLRFLMTLVMIVFAGGVICADEFTYTVASKTSVTSTDAPSGVTATFNNAYTDKGSDKAQLIKGKDMTLTINGFSGKITALKLNLKRTTASTGAGTLNVYVGTGNVFNKTLANSDLQKSNYRIDTFTFNSDVQSDNALKIVLAATGNSIYCNSFTIVYTPTSTDPSKTPTSLSFGEEYDGKTITKYIDDDFTAPTATITPSTIDASNIKYSSTNENVVLVDKDNGEAVFMGEGTATIKAEYAGDDTYAPSSASYTVEVKKHETTLSFGADYDNQTITKTTDDKEFTIPATLTPSIDGAEITYSSSNKSVAEVDNTGKVTLNAKTGTATITAEYAGNDDYAAATASYNIRVKNVGEEVTTFDFMQPKLYEKEESTSSSTAGDIQEGESLKSDDVYFTVTKQGDTNTRFWNDGLRLYKNVQFKINVKTGYHITNIVFTGANNFSADCGEYNSNSGKWEGDANAIVFKSLSTSTLKLKTATVTYVPDVTLTTAASSFATYAADYAVDYSAAGLDAYAITLNENEGTVAYNAIEGTTPAGTAVLVKGNASTTYSLAPSTDKEATVTTALQISDGNVTAADNLYYGFTTLNGVSGFKLVQNGVTIPAKKGYLKLSSADNAKTFYAFDGNTTGIEETFSKNEAEKALAPMYNISGQRVGEGYKGIVIVNGKKYVK